MILCFPQSLGFLAMALCFSRFGVSLLLAFAAVCNGATVHAAEPPVLHIYNWSNYIAEDTLQNFERETGIQVRYDTYDSNEALQSQLLGPQAGRVGYDIVVPGTHFAKTYLERGLLQKLDRSKLSNWGNLDRVHLEQLTKVDPGNTYLVGWLSGYVTLGIQVDKVKAALGNTSWPENPWSLLLDPRYVRKLKGCGVQVLDSASEVVPVALQYAGKPAHSHKVADYAAAGKVLAAIRPYFTGIAPSDSNAQALANGAACVVMARSGDIQQARAAAKGAAPQVVDVLMPQAGALQFVDAMAIAKDAAHVENAHRFINYLLRAEVHAALTNRVLYANPNAEALKFVRKDVAENKSIYLSASVAKTMVMAQALPDSVRKIQAQTFARFKGKKKPP
jgi:putrescine transport system substrate-binding protein